MKMVKLTKTSWGDIRKNLCFLIQYSNTQVDYVFIVGAAILEWPVLILSHGAHVDDMGLSLANFLILPPPPPPLSLPPFPPHQDSF